LPPPVFRPRDREPIPAEVPRPGSVRPVRLLAMDLAVVGVEVIGEGASDEPHLPPAFGGVQHFPPRQAASRPALLDEGAPMVAVPAMDPRPPLLKPHRP